jgi:hypothetical protein
VEAEPAFVQSVSTCMAQAPLVNNSVYETGQARVKLMANKKWWPALGYGPP